ncbi:MAG: hypothetical protein IPM56_18400 [Ignavibacteriales bacterium]|nr:MAG: hypothetical protein IPM56_18400 [Ignavibacteriales bacterium]
MYNPIYVLLNGSYDIIQLQGHNRQIFKFDYNAGLKNVFRNMANPFGVIKRTGTNDFIRTELLPIELTKKGAQWWPNYQLHLVGGGMTYTATREWYKRHNFPKPVLFSIITLSAYHILNEVIENGSYSGDNADIIADIYFFDIGGIILFSFDNVNRFFSEDLNLSDWSLQPSLVLNDNSLHNNGQYFSIKWKLPFLDDWSFFYYFGMNGLTGLSYKFDDSSSVSIGAGLRAKELVDVNESTHKKSISMTWNAGIFYDVDNSLLTSLHISGLTDYTVNLNIYPGLLKIGNFSPGLWLVSQKNGRILFGITTIWAPGIGIEW